MRAGLGRTYQSWTDQDAEKEFGQYAHFDKDAARALLAESGFPRQGRPRLRRQFPTVRPISFTILAPNGWTDWVNTTELVAESLNQIGIDARVSTPEPASWTQKLITGSYDMAINGYLTGETPYRSLDMGFHSRFAGKTRFAATRFVDPELDQGLDAFISTIDPAAQRQALNKVQMILAANNALRAALFEPDLVRVRHQALQRLVQQRQSGRPARRLRRHAGTAAAPARARAGKALSLPMPIFLPSRVGHAIARSPRQRRSPVMVFLLRPFRLLRRCLHLRARPSIF